MTKKEMSAILARATGEEVESIAAPIRTAHRVEIVKPPQKTLVMVKVRESIKRSLFYLGEVLATECMVTVDGAKGSMVLAGDDFEKVTGGAIIDALLNLSVSSCDAVSADNKIIKQEQLAVIDRLLHLKTCQEASRSVLNKELMKSKVHFNVMGE